MPHEPTFHLLVVDDNPINLELIARIVESHLPEVRSFTARSAAEGYRLIEAERIDGAFIDVQMPQITGFDMCRRLKGDPQTAHIPVVLLTAHIATPKSRAEGLDAGAHDFISQPVSNVEMLARIRVMLRLQRERTELAEQNQHLHRQLESNTAALRWLTALLEAGGCPATDPQLLGKLSAELKGAAQPSADQFANLLLPELPPGWQLGLLKLALLDRIPLDLARRLVPLNNVEEVLLFLWRQNYHLTQVSDGYRFSAQLHSYLLQQASVLLPQETQRDVHQLAASWFQERGDFPTALFHLLKGDQFKEVELLFSQIGLLLPLLVEPRATEILALIPQQQVAKRGWFSLFYGSCQMLQAPGSVGDWLELARSRFVAGGDERGELLTLAQQLRQHLFVDGFFAHGMELLPRLVALLERQGRDLDPANLSIVNFSLALGFGFFNGDSVRGEIHARDALKLAQQSGQKRLELEGRIACAYMAMAQGSGFVAFSEMENAWQLVADETSPPLLLHILATDLLLHSGHFDWYRHQRRQLTETFSRKILQQSLSGATLALYEVEALLLEGDLCGAAEMLQICSVEGLAAGNPHLQSRQLQYRALLHARFGRKDEARRDLAESRAHRSQAGGEFHRMANLLSVAQTLLELEDLDEAESLLKEALALSRSKEDRLVRPAIHALLTQLHLQRGETHQALEQQRDFLYQMRSREHNCCVALSREMLENLPLAVENDVLPEVARRLAATYLNSDILDDGRLVPRLQLAVLGSLRICCAQSEWSEVNGLGSRARKLLAELIFAPGHQLTIDTLCGRVWPESSSERARQNFDSAVLRLRKLFDELCREGAGRIYLTVERGIVTLPHVEIDVLRYRALVEQGRNHQRRGDLWQASHLLLSADRLWRGPLAQGIELSGIESLHEQYTELRFEQIELLAALSEELDCGIDLEALLLDGIRNDPIRDALIRRLLRLYRRQGRQVKQKKLLDQYGSALEAEDFSRAEIHDIIRRLESSTSA